MVDQKVLDTEQDQAGPAVGGLDTTTATYTERC